MVTNLSRVYTQNNEVVGAEVVLDASDEPTFRTFYKTTLSMGTQWFNGDILRNGVYENYELCFIGAPPVFTPIAHNVVRASFTLLTRSEQAPPGPPVPPGCPGLTVPVDGTAVGEVTSATLLWTAVAGAVTYRVYVWEDGDPQPGSPTTTTALLTYEVTGLTINTTYRWVVDAVSAEDEVSFGCESATFSTDEAPPAIEWLSATFTGDILGEEVTLTVIRTGDSSGTASADYDFTEGTALIGPDFIATPGTVTFDPGEVSKEIVVPLVRDYDSEVLADTTGDYDAYVKFNEASGSTFADLAGNGNFSGVGVGVGALTYQRPTLNLSASKSIKKNPGGSEFRAQRAWPDGTMPEGAEVSFAGWCKFQTSAADQSFASIGGHGGAGQVAKFQIYKRAADGKIGAFWDSDGGTDRIFVFDEDAPAAGVPFWFACAQDCSSRLIKFQVNDGDIYTVPWIGEKDPFQVEGRQTYVTLGTSIIPSWDNDSVGGDWSQFEFYYGSTFMPTRWTRWNLDASLTFVATLSNPVGAALGAIDETTMTIEAP